MVSTAKTVEEYLEGLPEGRRQEVARLREAILEVLPEGYIECVQYGHIGYAVPHSIYPPGYHCDPKEPLNFIGLGSQKSHIGLYLFCIYGDSPLKTDFLDAWKASGQKLDMGAACIRVKNADAVPIPVLQDLIRRIPVDAFLAQYTAMLAMTKKPTKAKASRSPASPDTKE